MHRLDLSGKGSPGPPWLRVRLHARTRLTLWYTALLAVTLLALGVLALVVVERTLYAVLDESLDARWRTLEQELLHELEESPRQNERRITHVTDELMAQGTGLDVLRFWDARGRLRASREGGVRQDPAATPRDPPAAAPSVVTETLAVGGEVRLLARPLSVRGEAVGTVQLGRSTADIVRVLAQLRLFGLAGTVLALGLAAAGGVFLAGRALAPIERITDEAEAIGADDLSRRLDLDLPDDEIGRLARAFNGMLARLDVAFQRQRQFTADASHELRTPLASIRTQLDVALSRPRETEAYVRVLQDVRSEHARLAELTDRLLTLARADAADALTLVPTDLQELVAETGVSVAQQAHAQGIRLAVELDDVPDSQGDPIWLRQLLCNLLENALRFTPAGGQVCLALRRVADGVTVTVRDTGTGIGPEHLPHLFERFYRVAAARDRASGGAGLGLAICAWVARAHGGRLTAESTLGIGTTMTLWLPVPAAPEPSHATESC